MKDRKNRLIWVFAVIIATTCISPWVLGYDPHPPRSPYRPPAHPVITTDHIGRYQLRGDWRLDTATGEVERVGDVYQQQKKPSFKCGGDCFLLQSGLESPKK